MVIRDHGELRELLQGALDAEGEATGTRFWSAAFELIRHEVAEELELYPAARKIGPKGVEAASQGLAQQAEAERLLSDLEKGENDQSDFETKLKHLSQAIDRHAAFEESELLPLIAGLSDEERFELGDHYAQAKKTAPSHPHPHGPDSLRGKVATGPIMAAIDRIRDAMHPGRPAANRSAGPNPV
jgi:cytochrome c553